VSAGGDVAGHAREELESKTGRSVVSDHNHLTLTDRSEDT